MSDQIQDQNVDTTITPPQDAPQGTPSIDPEALKQQTAREVGALYMGTLSEKENRIRELESQLQTSRATPAAVIDETPNVDGAQFLEKPGEVIAKIVDQKLSKITAQMETQLAPMNQLYQQFTHEKQLNSIKSQFAQAPQYKAVLDTYGDVIDTLIGNAPPTIQNVQQAIMMVPGLVQMGMVPSRDGSKSQSVPATIQSSSPAAPRKSADSKLRELSESEAKIAKRMGVSHSEYLRLLDAPDEVEAWKEKK